MNTVVVNLLEILKYTLPAVIVLIITYLIVRKFLVAEIQRKQIALFHQTQNITIPMRLQAYERLTVFVERIHPRVLVPRIHEQGMTVADLRYAMILTIDAEFQHNLSQQIYVSKNVWQSVKHMKEQELMMINQIAKQLPAEAPAKDLQVRMADYIMSAAEDDAIPSEIALQLINEEARIVLSQGSLA